MKYSLIKLFINCLFISIPFAKAQNSTHFGLFPTLDHSGTLSTKWDYSLYYFGAFNFSEFPEYYSTSKFFIFYSEQALTFKTNNNLSFTGSYVYQRTDPVQNDFVNENRFYVQATYKTSKNRTTFKNRIRYDGRFIENKLTATYPFTSRIRYLFGLQTPLKKEKNNLYFVCYNEFFFNTFKNTEAVYSENWASAAIGFQTAKTGSWEFGPLYIFWVQNKRYDLTNLLYLQLTWVTHLDFRKNKT